MSTTKKSRRAEQFVKADHKKAPNPASYPEPSHLSNSYWIRQYPIEFEDKWVKSPAPDHVDIAIIGSGITGAAVAFRISESRPDLKVAIFEARGLCTGATGRNGGHIGRPEAHDMIRLSKIFGVEEALRIRRFNKVNRDMMIETIEKLDAVEEVDLSMKGTLVVFENEDERQAFVDDLDFARRHGLKAEGYAVDTDWVLKRVKIEPSLARHGGAYLEKSGTIYPRKFVALLLRKALERMRNFSIHPYTPVSEVVHDPGRGDHEYAVVTTKGTTRAKVVLHATNGYASHLLPSLAGEDGIIGCTAHMLGVSPNLPETAAQLEGGFGYASFWHWILQRPNKGPYLYGLATAAKMGEYNDTITLDKSNSVRGEMLSFLERAFPHSFASLDTGNISYDWTGVQGNTKDGCSIVGRPAADKRGEFISAGHNGEGMGRCFACSTVITEAILAQLDQKD
ncbi:FAD dependent oxidoreductase [Aspergillus granulosus]|uniref:FAD dependent oxidoreductase n=1 Tax=Aspergillus granulosus TaxID=176169 RepID=A0ABR4H118_9EURO